MNVHGNFDDELYKFIIEIETEAFPPQWQAYHTAVDMVSLLHEMVGDHAQPIILTGDGWFCVMADHVGYSLEVCELAGHMSLRDLNDLLKYIKEVAAGREVTADLRECTSGKLLKFASRHGKVEVLDHTPYPMADGEPMVSVRFVIH